MKSQMITLLELIIVELGDECSVVTARDIKTVASRVGDQGVSFLTLTLPAFEKDFVKSLDEGMVAPTSFAGFRRRGGLPEFLGGFLELIFDRTTGILLEEPSIPAIRAVRQITLMYGKVKLECSPDRVRRTVEGYLKCEEELGQVQEHIVAEDRDRFKVLGNLLFGNVFRRIDNDVAEYSLLPKHGPGSTADGLLANAKWGLNTWTERLEEVAPHWRYATPRSYRTDRYDTVQFLEPGEELPVEVILVPKTLKALRVIAREPTHMQYMQQAVLERFTEYVREDSFLSRMIDTKYQLPNQELAREGSLTGALATIDLSEASDRVSNFLVEDLTGFFPHLQDVVQASRSKQASVPVISKDYRSLSDLSSMERVVIPLHKFASMGSALCFPMEMAVFLTVVFMGIERAEGIRFRTMSQLRAYMGRVRVYGDDIIVPTHATSSVVDHLARFGFVVNRGKSFWTGRFRESCGAEYYNGHDVTVTRVRNVFPQSRGDVEEMVSAVDLRNQLYKAGYWGAVRWLDNEISSLIPFPAVAETSTVLGAFSFLGFDSERMCPDLQLPMVRGIVVKHSKRHSVADGDAALMKFFLKRGDEPIYQEDHLEYAGRPVSSKLKYGWHYSS